MVYWIGIFIGICGHSLMAQSDSAYHRFYGRVAYSYSVGSNETNYQFDPLQSSSLSERSYATPILGHSSLYILGGGYMVLKNIGIEANVSFLSGRNTDLYTYETNALRVSMQMTGNNHILFQPTMVFRADLGRFHPYIKVGMVVPLSYKTELRYQIEDKSNSQNRNVYRFDVDSKLNPGLNGCVGVSYTFYRNWEIFFEAEEDNVRSFYLSATRTSSDVSSPSLTTSPIQDRYVFLDAIDRNAPNPTEMPSFPISFNRQAYNIGLKFNF